MSRGQNSFIYFLRCADGHGPIKIGCSAVPLARVRTFASWSPFPLEIIATAPGTLPLEQLIHRCFADAHSHGEWFHPIPRLLEAIGKIQSGIALELAMDLSRPLSLIRKDTVQAVWTPARRKYQSYVRRLRWAETRVTEARGREHQLPHDVENILQGVVSPFTLTDEQVERFETVLSAPYAHLVLRAET